VRPGVIYSSKLCFVRYDVIEVVCIQTLFCLAPLISSSIVDPSSSLYLTRTNSPSVMPGTMGDQKIPEIWISRNKDDSTRSRVSRSCGKFPQSRAWCEGRFRIGRVFDLRLLTQQPAASRITQPHPVKYINSLVEYVNVWCQYVISLEYEYISKSKGNISGHCAQLLISQRNKLSTPSSLPVVHRT